jgi:hypothetical protein
VILAYQQDTSRLKPSDYGTPDHIELFSTFMSYLYVILLEYTPAENLCLIPRKIKDRVLAKKTSNHVSITNKFSLEAATLMTSSIEDRIGKALSSNPEAREYLLRPEVGALVEQEAKKQGLENDYNKVGSELKSNLQAELEEKGIDADNRSVTEALKSIGRRNILNNIKDALDGKLYPRLIDAVNDFSHNVYECVESIWEFTLTGSKETRESIRDWLFRRKQ